MAPEHGFALDMTEAELELRRAQLRTQADDLAERVAWLNRWSHTDAPLPPPPADWPEALNRSRAEIAAAHAALQERRLAQAQAEEAALLIWQMQLDTANEAVKSLERAHRQPPPVPRASLNRTVEAPELSVDKRRGPDAVTEEWRLTAEMPQAKLVPVHAAVPRPTTVAMTAEDHLAADAALLPRAVKRRTGRMTPLPVPHQPPADSRDLIAVETPYDLPTIAPAGSLAPARHRARAVTEPFVAAMDLDGLYLKRRQIVLDRGGQAVHVLLDAESRHAELDDMPTRPQQFTFRSREGDLQHFPVLGGDVVRTAGLPTIVLDVQHWQPAELQAFQRALDTLP